MNKWPTLRLSSYQPCAGCGAHCDRGAESSAAEPCWGRVLFESDGEFDEFEQRVHTCAGHECAQYKLVFGVK